MLITACIIGEALSGITPIPGNPTFSFVGSRLLYAFAKFVWRLNLKASAVPFF